MYSEMTANFQIRVFALLCGIWSKGMVIRGHPKNVWSGGYLEVSHTLNLMDPLSCGRGWPQISTHSLHGLPCRSSISQTARGSPKKIGPWGPASKSHQSHRKTM